MLNSFNLNHLYYFYIIAKEGSLKDASLSLHVSQPTLTYQVKSLEKFLDTTLFEKKGRKMVLNTKGKLVFDYCSKIFPLCNDLIEVVKFQKSKEHSFISIGVIPAISTNFTNSIISEILLDKQIKLTVYENEFKNMISSLHSGEIDIIFSDYKISNLPKSIECIKYLERKFAFLCNSKIKFKSKGFKNQILEIPFINYTHETYMHSRILHYFEKHNLNVNIIAEIDDIELLKKMLLTNDYCAVIPTLALEEKNSLTRFKKMNTFPDSNQSIYVYIHDENTKPALKKLLKKFKRENQNLYPT
ncbi:MAG: hypothetical protein CL678_02905 [Bdellovibrionaceae bacterium]|nr:hypothetical protein [Pseudobdellovibrionaceae bacterium]|tara:strand:- start:57 stop:959 length:903 start_codon:yes stop_codon:yes gene_type:complete